MSLDIDTLRRQAETPELVGRAQYEAIARDLTDAFADDPVMCWFLRDDARRDKARLAVFRLILELSADQNPRILRPAGGGAVSIWIRSEDMSDSGSFLQELRATFIFLAACGTSRVKRIAAVREAMDANHPKDRPHDYLSFLGVIPEAQGHGVGSRLMVGETARLDAAGRHAYLETGNPRTLSLYGSHGFKVIGEFRPGGDGPQMWALWREPT